MSKLRHWSVAPMQLHFEINSSSVCAEYHSTFSVTDPSLLLLPAIESQSEVTTVRCFVECPKARVISNSLPRHP